MKNEVDISGLYPEIIKHAHCLGSSYYLENINDKVSCLWLNKFQTLMICHSNQLQKYH